MTCKSPIEMNVGMHPIYPGRSLHDSLGQNEPYYGYPTEAAGPGHEGSGSVVVPPYYAPHQKHHPHLHSRPPIPTSTSGHHHLQQPPHSQQQQPAGMRVSPAPPPTAGPQNSPHPHSPHMSPAVGGPGSVVMPPHPGSGPNENRNSMHAPGYPPGGPPHIPTGPPGPPHGYPSKMGHIPGPPGPPYSQPGFQQGPGGHQYPPTRPQGHMMQPYPQNYSSGGPQGPQGPQGPPSSMPPGHQYAPRPPHNSHVPPNQPYGYSHFGQQQWGQGMGQPSMMGGMPGKGGPSQMPGQPNQPPGANSVGGPRPHTPPHYLKQHLQHKMGGYAGPPPAGPQMYPNGPGMSPGPPGPPGMINSRDSPQNSMPPPTSTPQPLTPSSSMVDGEHPPHSVVPPCNTTNSTVNMNSNIPNSVNSINSNPPQIGPDGNPVVDEASQQSTVSNTSAASGEDRSCTPKPHKEAMMGVPSSVPVGPPGMVMMGGPVSHPPSHPNVNSASSPGTVSMTSQQDEFDNMNSPGWPRSPSTGPPVVYANSQPPPPPEIYRTAKDQKIHVSKNEIWTSKNPKKSSHKSKNVPGDSILRLYEMSDSPERRAWLDKLLRFMEDNKTPITACPTISKNPLDLYALYLHVRERGGFEEVTKNKQWKDVAAVMGIGASSSGSYTLRRHYMKHILSYECKFDRGGIDPQPIINLIESSQKKKNSKTLSVPSPGSNSSSMDGFSNGPHMGGGPGMPGPYPQYPPSSEFPGHMQPRPPNPSTPGYQGYQGNQYPGYQGMHGGYPPQGGYPNSGFPPDGRGYQPTGPPNHQGNYQGYQQGYPRPGFPQPPPPPPPPQQGPYPQDQYPMGSTNVPQTSYGTSQLAKQLLNPPPRNNGPGPVMQNYQATGMYPQKPGAAPSPGPQPSNSTTPYQGPRRHPDFDKGQPGWRPPSNQFGFGGQVPTGPPVPLQQPPWPRPNDSGPQPGPPQWSQPRYPPPPVQPFPNQQPRWSSTFGSSASGPRPPPVVGPGNKNYLVPPATSFKSGGYGTYMGKQLFPMDSVEAVTPVLIKRKRMGKADVSPVDPWRLLMSLRCGLASEVSWALDILNILLFDDQTVIYFGLHHMPGLLEALIEHLRRGLINMFNICSELELGMDDEATGANKRIKAEQHDYKDRPWFEPPPPSPPLDLDLGRLEDDFDPTDKELFLRGTDYTMASRTGKSVRIVKREAKIFMKEGSREWDKWEGFDSGIDTWSVGGGECTAHIICSMQSSVPPLPYTRLIPNKDKLEFIKDKLSPSFSDKIECKSPVVSECIIKIEKVEVKVTEKVETKIESNVVSELKTEQKTLIAKDIEPINLIPVVSDKCNGPKETPNKPLFSQKINRKNNTKSSKLDEVLKRIKKEPAGSSSVGLSIFNKMDKNVSQSDTKSILDQILNKDQGNDSDNVVNKEEVKPVMREPKPIIPDSVKIEPPKVVVEKDTKVAVEKDKPQLCVENKMKSPIKSPTKLLAISPSNLSNKTNCSKDNSVSRRDSTGFKRPYEDLEEESWGPDEASLSTTTEGQDWLAKRVMVVGTVIRNLSFIPGNEDIMSKNAPLLALLGKTILLHHEHPKRSPATAHYDRDEEMDFSDWCSSLAPDTYWWWPYLHHVHENTLVTLANIAGHLDLSYYPEEISRPILNGLLHWATCPASYGQDTLPGGGSYSQSALSPQRLALEALVKLCVLDSNTDLVLATPPFSRLDMLCSQLTRLLCRGEDQVLREFSVNLFHYFSVADSGVARVIAMQNGCVSLLVAFIEEAESAALNVANVQGVTALKENPELMGTSLDMVRRSANTLVNLSRVPDNARVIAACENRFLNLVMSQILDTYVASQLSQVLFNVALVQSENSNIPSPPLSPSAFMVIDGKEEEPSGLTENKSIIAQPVIPSENEDSLSTLTESKIELKPEVKEENNSLPVDSERKDTTTAISTSNNEVSSPTPVSPNSTPNNNTSTVSTSSCSSPMSVTSHPPLSPSLPHATSCTELPVNNSTSLKCDNGSAVDTKAAPQVAPTL